jgi:uncharacterized protein
VNHYVYKLIPPRTTFHADMSAEEQAIMGRHVAYWQDLLSKRTAVVFGPVLDPTGTWGLAVVAAETEADVRRLGDNDPAVTSEMATYNVFAMPRAIVRP